MHEPSSAREPVDDAQSGYVTLVARFWIDASSGSLRGTVKDVHTGAELPLDLTRILEFVRNSLRHRVAGAIDESLPN